MISFTGMRKFCVTCVVALAAFAAITLGDENQFPNFQDIAKNIPGGLNLNNLSNGFDLDNLPGSLNGSNLPNIEEGEKRIKEKCLKNGGNTSYDDFLLAKADTEVCLKSLINYTEFQTEVEGAKPTGDLDLVFRKYCKKSPILKGCISNFTGAIEPCLDPSEKTLKNTVQNITEALLNFICFKEGDKIALFIAEGGPGCITEKNEAIQSCLNSTFRKYIPSDLGEETVLPLLKLGEPECQDVFELQDCLVKELETCEEPTPANIIDSLFKFVYKQTPCNDIKPRKELQKSGETSVASTFHVFIHLLVLALSVHLWR